MTKKDGLRRIMGGMTCPTKEGGTHVLWKAVLVHPRALLELSGPREVPPSQRERNPAWGLHRLGRLVHDVFGESRLRRFNVSLKTCARTCWFRVELVPKGEVWGVLLGCGEGLPENALGVTVERTKRVWTTMRIVLKGLRGS